MSEFSVREWIKDTKGKEPSRFKGECLVCGRKTKIYTLCQWHRAAYHRWRERNRRERCRSQSEADGNFPSCISWCGSCKE